MIGRVSEVLIICGTALIIYDGSGGTLILLGITGAILREDSIRDTIKNR